MNLLVYLLFWVLLFAVLCWAVSVLPLPGGPPWLRNALYFAVAVIMIVLLLGIMGLVPLGLHIRVG